MLVRVRNMALLIALVGVVCTGPADGRTKKTTKTPVTNSPAPAVNPRRLSAVLQPGSEQRPKELSRTSFDDGTGLLVYSAYSWGVSASELCVATPISPQPTKAPCVLDDDVRVMTPLVDVVIATGSKSLRVVGVLRSAGVSNVTAKGSTGSTAMRLVDVDPTNPHVLYVGRTADATVTFEARNAAGAIVASIDRTAYVDEFDSLLPIGAGELGFGVTYDVRLVDVGLPCVRTRWNAKEYDTGCNTVFEEGQPVLAEVLGYNSRTDQAGTRLIVIGMASHRVASVEIVGAKLVKAVFVETRPELYRTVVLLTGGGARHAIWRDSSGVEVGRSNIA